MHDPYRKELRRSPAATGWSDIADDMVSPLLGLSLPAWADPFERDEPLVDGRAGQLAGRRREQMVRVLAGLRGRHRTVRVAVYARTEAGGDPGRALAAAREHAENVGWSVSCWHFDEASPRAAASTLDGWKQAAAAVSGGFAHGIVTVDRDAVAPGNDHDAYAALLGWFERHGAFLQHVPGVTL